MWQCGANRCSALPAPGELNRCALFSPVSCAAGLAWRDVARRERGWGSMDRGAGLRGRTMTQWGGNGTGRWRGRQPSVGSNGPQGVPVVLEGLNLTDIIVPMFPVPMCGKGRSPVPGVQCGAMMQEQSKQGPSLLGG